MTPAAGLSSMQNVGDPILALRRRRLRGTSLAEELLNDTNARLHAASAKARCRRRIGDDLSMVLTLVMAPMRMPPPSCRIPTRPGTFLRFTTVSGRNRPVFMSTTRSVPPARTRPPPPASVNRRIASLRDAGS